MKKSAALGILCSGGAESSCISIYTPVAPLRRNTTSLRSRRFFTSSQAAIDRVLAGERDTEDIQFKGYRS
ncbi:MAG: hypothetical protein ACREYE_30075 [Gammaproteobacteria bacterium]